MTENPWLLLRLNPQIQPKFVDHISASLPDVDLYFPLYSKVTRPANKRTPITVQLPVYPGYIFARVNLETDDFFQLTHAPYRASFVRFNGNLGIVPDRIIPFLREKESLNQLVVEKIVENPYYPGRRVRIILPLITIEGFVLHMIGQNRVKIDTQLGPSTVHLHSVELA